MDRRNLVERQIKSTQVCSLPSWLFHWLYFFGIPSKPKPGGKYQTTLIGTQIGQKTWTQPGIFGHTTGGGTHVDPYPTPKLIAMLKRLGFIE